MWSTGAGLEELACLVSAHRQNSQASPAEGSGHARQRQAEAKIS